MRFGKVRFGRVWLSALVFVSGFVAAGCATHPLQDQVTRLELHQVVKKIRCEAKAAIVERDPDNAFAKAVVVFNFRFVVTETNDVDASAKFVVPVGSAKLSFGVDATKSLARVGDREVKLSEKFADVVRTDCGDAVQSPRRDIAHPITGTIGLKEVVGNFFDIADLRQGKSYSFVKTYKDVVTFTTTVSGGGSIKLTPAASKLAEAGGSANAERIDKHELLVEFTPPPPAENLLAWQDNVQAVQLVSGVLTGAVAPDFGKSPDIAGVREALKRLTAQIENQKKSLAERKSNLDTDMKTTAAPEAGQSSAFVERERSAIVKDQNAISSLEKSVDEINNKLTALRRSSRATAAVKAPRGRSAEIRDEISLERASEKAYRNQILDAQRDLRDVIVKP